MCTQKRVFTKMRQVLWWLIGGSRGGRSRLRIVLALEERPMNTNQLSNELDLDYKTTQHHLELLTENGVLTTMGEGYGKMYFLTENMKTNMDVLTEVAQKADIADALPDESRGQTLGDGDGNDKNSDDMGCQQDDNEPDRGGEPT